MIAVLLVAMGCSASPSEAGTDTDLDLSIDTGFLPSATTTVEPSMTADDLADFVEAWLVERGPPVPQQIWTDYLTLMAAGDDTCPGDPTSYILGLQGCTSSTGYTYTGLTIYGNQHDEETGGGVRDFEGFMLADFVFIEPDGTRMVGSGAAGIESFYEGDTLQRRYLIVGGSWSYPKSAAPWLAAGASASAHIDIGNAADGKVGVSLEMGSGGSAIAMTAVSFADSDCPDIASRGTISVRQDDGSWNFLTLQGGCTPCFDATWENEVDLGEGCMDLAPLRQALLRWAEEPLF